MDLAWVAPRVCRHEAVIEEAMRQSPVLPARFATLFQTIASLAQFLSCTTTESTRSSIGWATGRNGG